MGPTQEAVKAVQDTSLALSKAKDNLRQKTAELEKLKRGESRLLPFNRNLATSTHTNTFLKLDALKDLSD